MSDDAIVTKGFSKLTYFLLGITFLLVLLGGYVKAIGAGLSCPDWPLCYKKLFPFFDGNIYPYEPYMIFAEWFHRLIAVTSGFVMLIVALKSRKYKNSFRPIYTLSVIGLILFLAQGAFGGLTVTEDLEPIIVVAHLGTAMLIIMIELILALYATQYSTKS